MERTTRSVCLSSSMIGGRASGESVLRRLGLGLGLGFRVRVRARVRVRLALVLGLGLGLARST